jgi:hypothetical protein
MSMYLMGNIVPIPSLGVKQEFLLDFLGPPVYTEDMKMSEVIDPFDLKIVERGVKAYDTEANREAYRNGQFDRADKVTDLNRRYRWDLYWTARRQFGTVRDIMNEASTYLLDSHIDTFLKSIIHAL